MARGHSDPEFKAWVAAARATPIGDYVAARGINARGRIEREGDCPNCGKRRGFALNTFKNVWFCRGCKPEGGDPIAFVEWFDGCNFLRAVETLTGIPAPQGGGTGPTTEQLAELAATRAARKAKQEALSAKFREDERQRCIADWKAALPAPGTVVEDYLALRGCTLPAGAHLKFEPRAKLWGDRSCSAPIHTGPAMLACILGPEGRFAGVHRTWIDLGREGGKVLVADPKTGEVEPAKKVRGSQLGGRIELVRHPEPRRLFIGEGIETTLSVRDGLIEAGRDLSDAAFWCSINLGNLGGPHAETVPHPTLRDLANRPRRVPGPNPAGQGIPVPDSVEEIVTLGDGDSEPFLTQLALTRASHRWARPGRVIRGAMAPAGSDFNNLRRGT